MRIVQFLQNGKQYIGLELKEGGDLINLNHADTKIPSDMRSFIDGGDALWKSVERYIKRIMSLLRDKTCTV